MSEARRYAGPAAQRHERSTRKLLRWAGAIEIAAGALHFAMPSAAYQSKGFSSLQPAELGFVTLVTLAVGILLLAFGALSVYLASSPAAVVELLFGYALVKTFLWAGRVILELAHPVRLRLFFVEPFTIVVMPLLVLELLLFVTSAVLARRALVAGAAAGEILTG